MNKTANSFFDDIIQTLSIESKSAIFANIKPEILNEFFSVTDQATSPNELQPPLSGQLQSPQNKTPIPTQQRTEEKSNKTPPPPVHIGMSNADLTAISQMDIRTLHHNAKLCNRCPLHQTRKNIVFGTGNPQANLMFIGDSPGIEEDDQGIPFVGEVGQRLTKMINAMQFTRSDVYITNIIKCKSPKNRNPEQKEADTCIAFLKRQIELIQPKVIVLFGPIPLQFLMHKKNITNHRGHWMDYKGIKVMPTFHPQYLKFNPDSRKDVWNDLQQVMQIFGKKHPTVAKR